MPLVEEMFRDWEVPRRVYEIESGSNQIQIRQASVSMVKNGDISSNLMCRMEQMTCKPDSNWNESIFLHFVVSNVQVFYCMFSFHIMREKFCISLSLFFFFFSFICFFCFYCLFSFSWRKIFFLTWDNSEGNTLLRLSSAQIFNPAFRMIMEHNR